MTLVDPPLAPTLRGLRCPPAPPSDHWYAGLGVLLGDSEAWQPQKVGGCGWARCPRNSVLSHIAQDTARSWFWAYLTQTTHIQAIWAIVRPFLGNVVERECQKGLFVTGQPGRTCSIPTVCICLADLSGFRGRFERKMAFFGPKPRRFGRAPPNLAPTPRGTTGEFLAQNLDLARAPPRL